MDFSIRATDTRFLEMVRRLLGGFRVAEGSRELLFSAAGGEERRLAGGKAIRGISRLYFLDLKIFQGPSLDHMMARLLSAIRDWTNSQSNEYFRVRAGGVAVAGQTILMPSLPSPHLSTLVALLVKQGADYVGDEIVNIDPLERVAQGTQLPLLIDDEDLGLFPDLDGSTTVRRSRGRTVPDHMRPRRGVLLEDLGGVRAPPSPIDWIIFPSLEDAGPTELRSLGRSEALFRFTQAALNLHIWTDRAFLLMNDLLEASRVRELRVGSLEDAAALLARLIPEARDGDG